MGKLIIEAETTSRSPEQGVSVSMSFSADGISQETVLQILRKVMVEVLKQNPEDFEAAQYAFSQLGITAEEFTHLRQRLKDIVDKENDSGSDT